MSYTIICNSSVDLPSEVAKGLNLKVVPLKYNIEDKTYFDYLDHSSLEIEKFYQLLRDGVVVTTSQINSNEYEEAIKEEFDKGKDVLILSFSSALSGSFNAARIAVENLQNEKQKAYLIDTKCASLGEGLFVTLVAEQQQAGKLIEEVYEFANKLLPHMAHWFTVDDLMFLKRGGRLSGASAVIGSMLRIKPILHVDNEGRLVPRFKAIGRKKSLNRLTDILKDNIRTDISNVVYISHGDDLNAALELKEKLLELNLGIEIKIINFIGPVIGAHSGPGTIALFFTADNR